MIQRNGMETFTFLYHVNMFMPFILGGLGIVSALLGIKGYRMVLVVLHLFLQLLFFVSI